MLLPWAKCMDQGKNIGFSDTGTCKGRRQEVLQMLLLVWFTQPDSMDNFIFLISSWTPLFLYLYHSPLYLHMACLISLIVLSLSSTAPIPYISPIG